MKKTVLLCAILASSMAAIAQTPEEAPNAPATTKIGPSNDPNEVVCIRQSQIGSRVAARRVCRTRAEWAAHRAEYKQEIERAQQQLQTSGQ